MIKGLLVPNSWRIFLLQCVGDVGDQSQVIDLRVRMLSGTELYPRGEEFHSLSTFNKFCSRDHSFVYSPASVYGI